MESYLIENNTVFKKIVNNGEIKKAIGNEKQVELKTLEVQANQVATMLLEGQVFDLTEGEYILDASNNDLVKVEVDGIEYDVYLVAGFGSFDYESPNVGEVEKILVNGKEFDIHVN